MRILSAAVLLSLLVPMCSAFAAEHPAVHKELSMPLPVSGMAVPLEVPVMEDPNATSTTLYVWTGRVSAGVAASLPDGPGTRIPYTDLPFYLFRFSRGEVAAPNTSRVVIGQQAFGAQEVSLLDSSPFAGVGRRMGAPRFNTSDGSMMYDFAVCYRLSNRTSIEVIPGDPAPVKLPVATMQNNMGVTMGMVVRLSRQQ